MPLRGRIWVRWRGGSRSGCDLRMMWVYAILARWREVQGWKKQAKWRVVEFKSCVACNF